MQLVKTVFFVFLKITFHGHSTFVLSAIDIFAKGYTQNWSIELFTVAKKFATNPPTYSIKDLAGELIKGKFYEQELQKVIKTLEDEYIVEKVLKTRRRNGQIEHFVKWRGYADNFNSWTATLRRL